MVGSGQDIPDKDAEEIGFPARQFLRQEGAFVIVVDDLEADRASQVHAVFARYRDTLDRILFDEAPRASVHFLVNMLEAYYFADANAVNKVLRTDLDDYDGDVETIRNPKSRLKQMYPAFDEVAHGSEILEQLDVDHVLARPNACASLRTMFAWASEATGEADMYAEGVLFERTKAQIEALRDWLGRS